LAGGLRNFDSELAAKIEDFRLMIGHLQSVGLRVEGARFLEVGTGWYPTFPLCLYLLGADCVETFDLRRHLKRELVELMLRGLQRHLPPLADLVDTDRKLSLDRLALVARRLLEGTSLESATAGRVRYHAPADATATGLPASSIDVVFSNSVLEHVPGPVIEQMFAESWRILREGGAMFHSVNCGDHYAYVDRSINQLNYLRFSDEEWARWNNQFLYQNRLRAADFTAMATRAGFAVEVDTSRPHPDRLNQLQRITVHPSLAARYPRDQLAITSIDFVARRPGPAHG
jgi:hypothetical protein